MTIEFVKTCEDAKKCNQLLTKLIQSERRFNCNIKEEYKVEEWFENIVNDKSNIIIVAKEDDLIVGYLFCKIITVDDDPTLESEALIDGLYVEDEFRNKGIATKLIEAAKKWCREQNVKYININVFDENSIALNLYYKMGFKDLERKLRLGL